MTDVKPQAYACIVDGVFGSVHRHRIDAQPFVSEHGLCVEEVPLYTAKDVGLVEQEPVAWLVSCEDNQYCVDSLDDYQLVSDLTNHGATCEPLYTHPAHDQSAEIERLRAQLISEWYMDEIPTFRQGAPIHEMEDVVTAEQVTGYVKRIAELREQVRVLTEALEALSNIYLVAASDSVREALATVKGEKP